MITFESTFPSATNILVLYIAMRINCQLNVYPVINDTRWNHFSVTVSWECFYTLYCYVRTNGEFVGNQWSMIPFETTFTSNSNVFAVCISVNLDGQFNRYAVIDDTLWKHKCWTVCVVERVRSCAIMLHCTRVWRARVQIPGQIVHPSLSSLRGR